MPIVGCVSVVDKPARFIDAANLTRLKSAVSAPIFIPSFSFFVPDFSVTPP